MDCLDTLCKLSLSGLHGLPQSLLTLSKVRRIKVQQRCGVRYQWSKPVALSKVYHIRLEPTRTLIVEVLDLRGYILRRIPTSFLRQFIQELTLSSLNQRRVGRINLGVVLVPVVLTGDPCHLS